MPAILASIVPPTFPDNDFAIADYGASSEPDGDSAPAIRAAIAACNQAGGGRVVVPAGQWLSNGPIHLLSNVNFYMEDGASLKFGADPEDYLPLQLVRWQGIRCYNYSPLIYAFQQENIAITGSGSFHGQGAAVWNRWTDKSAADWTLLQNMARAGAPLSQRVFGPGHYLRPAMFEPYECNNILVQGVTFEDSPFWTMHPTFCTNVTIQNVNVLPGAENDDGCDPDSCLNVLIENCNFETTDDNVSIKAGLLPDAEGLPGCENVVIQGCNCLRSAWSGLTLGSDTGAFIRNVFMQNCTVNRCQNAHFLKAHTNYAGGIENVYIRNNQVFTCHSVLALLPDDYDNPGSLGPPAFVNVNMENVTCVKATALAFLFSGDPRLPIDGVTLSDIAIQSTSARAVAEVVNTINLSATNITLGGRPVKIGS